MRLMLRIGHVIPIARKANLKPLRPILAFGSIRRIKREVSSPAADISSTWTNDALENPLIRIQARNRVSEPENP